MNELPPQNIETEESVLAGCILHPDYAEQALDILKPEHFYRTAHQQIFKIIGNLTEQKEPVDLITVATKFKAKGAVSFVAALIDNPVPINIEHSCNIIKERAMLRTAINICSRIRTDCYQTDNPQETISQAQADILNIDSISQKTFSTLEELTIEGLDRYEEMSHQEKETGIKSGFLELDTLTGGFRGSKLILLAGRPGSGKTALMLNMTRNMAKRGHKVGVFSIEMEKEELFDRLMSSETGINSIQLQTGRLNVDEWNSVHEAAARKSNWDITVDDTGGLTINELRRRIRKFHKKGVEIIFIDQLSKIIGDRKKSKFAEMTEIVENLGTLKKEIRIPIVLLCQINRKAEESTNRKPMLGNLKNTGQLEEEADIALIIHREYEYTREENKKHEAVLDLAKHRNGPTRNINLYWNAKTTTFGNPPQEY